MTQTYDYRNTIQSELDRRIQRNPRYTLRSFARDLKISASSLSLLLAGKQGLSLNTATAIGQLLKLDAKEMELFLVSVKSLHSRISKERIESKKALEKLQNKYQETILKSQTFREVSKWQYFALTEYLRSHPTTKPEALSQALDLPLATIEDYLLKLQSAGILVRKSGKWAIEAEILTIMSEAPSRVIRDFHQGVIARAAESIDGQQMTERSLSSTLFAFDPEKFPEIQNKIKEFRLGLISEFSTTAENAEVFCFSQQLVQLSNLQKAEIL